MNRLSRKGLRGALALGCLLAGLPAAAQTLLLVVRENVNARPLPPPLAVREGISGSLFDAGYVILDAPGWAPSPAGELSRVARSAGADMVFEVVTDYSDTPLGGDLLRIAARTSYAVIDAATGAILAQGKQEATNRNRERDVGRNVLGGEIGKEVAVQVEKVLRRLGGSASD